MAGLVVIVLHLGLVLAALGFLYAGGASWAAGYTPEVAILRGLVAFMAISLVAYFGELIVATTPPRAAAQRRDVASRIAAGGGLAADEGADDAADDAVDEAALPAFAVGGGAPVPLGGARPAIAAPSAERERRAA